MQRRTLGPEGPEISAIGFGAMSLSGTYGEADDRESQATLSAAFDAGITYVDTAEVYGLGHNERLVGRWLRERGEEVFVSTKFGLYPGEGGMRVDGRPERVLEALTGSLERLGVERIDLWYLHRVDPEVPVEETVGAMAEQVKAGRVQHLGLSAVRPETLRRAHAVHPITAVQSEYSLWTREPEAGLLDTCRELGVGFVPYSPLGRGFLVDHPPAETTLDGFRRGVPRFQGANFDHNLALAHEVRAIAHEHELTAAQLALAWCGARHEHVIPIFGTRRAERVRENAAAGDLVLRSEVLQRLERACPPGAAHGDALPSGMSALSEG